MKDNSYCCHDFKNHENIDTGMHHLVIVENYYLIRWNRIIFIVSIAIYK